MARPLQDERVKVPSLNDRRARTSTLFNGRVHCAQSSHRHYRTHSHRSVTVGPLVAGRGMRGDGDVRHGFQACT
jgi:hypothetical protein